MKSYLKLTLQGFLIATVSSLILASGIAYAGADPTVKPCPNCKRHFRPPTHGHHAKIKRGQPVETVGGSNPGGQVEKLDANTWPGPHPGIGGSKNAHMGKASVRSNMNGAARLQGGQQALPAGQRLGQ